MKARTPTAAAMPEAAASLVKLPVVPAPAPSLRPQRLRSSGTAALLLASSCSPHLPLRKTRLSSWPRRYEHGDSHDEPTMPSSAKSPGASHFPQKLKNFFRINSLSSSNGSDGALRSDSKSSFRQSKFFTTVGRLRSTTVASEGHALDEALSPTAHANPYFAHQGQPGLRHHNDGSVPPSPPDTPAVKVNGPNGAAAERATTATKEELARKLRRVASAPNAQGLFSKGKGSGERPATAELGKEPIMVNKNASTVGLVEAKGAADAPGSLGVPDKDGLGALPSPRGSPLAFRRTYSSNSIKVRNVEVGPQSFDKIKLIGKGDVGKVYLVREKKSSRLYAMKGELPPFRLRVGQDRRARLTMSSVEQEGDDQAQQDQEGLGRTGDPRHQQPPLHRDPVPLLPIRRPSVPVHGVLQRRRILPGVADPTGQVHCRRRRSLLRRRGDGGA